MTKKTEKTPWIKCFYFLQYRYLNALHVFFFFNNNFVKSYNINYLYQIDSYILKDSKKVFGLI